MSNLALIGTSDRLDEDIISISGHGNRIYCGCKSKIYAFTRAKHICGTYEWVGGSDWRSVLVLGQGEFVCAVNNSNTVVIWHSDTAEVISQFSFPAGEFDVVTLMQPVGYIDKLLLASTNGKMRLVNYRSSKVVYAFERVGSGRITAIGQSPNNDTIAIGSDDGSVCLHNLLYDKTLLKVSSHDLGAISSIAFRTDIEGELLMLTGTASGHVSMWNLEKSRNVGQTRNCHQHGAVSSLFCVPGKPLLVSNGPDNSIKVWNYERPDGTPVLLRSRDGHWLPPTAIRWWPTGPMGTQVLSTGGDGCLRVFCTRDERSAFSMGSGGGNKSGNGKKVGLLTPAVHVAACNARDGIWDSVAMVHRGQRAVTTWNHSKRTRGSHHLDCSTHQDRDFVYKRITAERCALSACGNFLLVGYSSGTVAKFNMQSGLQRGSFTAHSDAPIAGLEVGQTGARAVLVTAGGTEVRMWDVDSLLQLATHCAPLHLPATAAHTAIHPNGDMVAVATVDGWVHLVQLAGFAVFAHIAASTAAATTAAMHTLPLQTPVTAMTFCHGVDLLVIADGTLVKTFDYVNNKLVDCFKVHRAVTQLAMAPNDSCLVSTHEDDLGLYLWALKLNHVDMKLASLPIDYTPSVVLTQAKMYCDNADDSSDSDGDNDEDNEADGELGEGQQTVSATGVSDACLMARLSGLPSSYYSSMLNLENVRVRNENATRGGMVASSTFFLPQIVETLEGMKWVDGDHGDEGDDEVPAEGSADKLRAMRDGEKKRRIDELGASDIHRVDRLTEMLLQTTVTNDDFDLCMGLLLSLSPTAVDHEVQMLDPLFHRQQRHGYGPLQGFLRLVGNQVSRCRCVELCQMYVACLLQHHVDCLTEASADSSRCGIDGLMQQEALQTSDIEAERLRTVALCQEVVHQMRAAHRSLGRDLAQIVEMVQLAKNNQ